MIPVELIIEGIYSYRERTRIDFQPLLDAHLFGIFGSVGSGKSSLLDAITFALYGQVERMNKRDSVAANMFNLDADKAYIRFTFDSLVDGRRYQCLATGKRRKSGPVISRECFILEEETPIPVPEQDVHQAIGLTYDHFTRTVIVPQGKFQEFLQLSDKDRTEMMQHLFHLHRFDLAGPMRGLIGRTRSQEQHLSGQLEALERILVTPLTQLEEDRKRLAQELKQATQLVKRTSRELEIMTNYQRAKTGYQQNREALQALLPLIESLGLELARLQEQHLLVQKKEERLPDLQKLQQQLQTLVDILRTKQEKSILDKQIQAQREGLSPTEKKMQDLRQSLDKSARSISELLSGQAVSEVIQERTTWYYQWQQTEEKRKSLEIKGKEGKSSLEEARSEQTAFWQQHWNETLFEGPLPEEPGSELPEIIRKKESALAETEQRILHLQLQAGLLPYAAELKEGIPCPLCGALDHPAPYTSAQNQDVLHGLETSRDQKREAIRQLRRLSDQARQLQNQVQVRDEQLRTLRQDYLDLQSLQSTLSATLNTWEMTLPDLIEWLKQQAALHTQISTTQQVYQRNQVALQQIESEYQQLEANLKEQESMSVRLQSRLDTLTEQIGSLDSLATYLDRSEGELQAKIQELDKEHQSILQEVRLSQRSIQEAQDGLKQHQIRKEYLEETHQNVLEDIRNGRAALAELRPDRYPATSEIDADQAVLTLKQELEQLETAATQWSNQLAVLDTRIKETALRMEEARKLQAEHQQVSNKLENLKTLDTLFRGKGMVEFAASRYLRQILEHANQRFYKMTRHKLRLELSEDNRIMVRDYYHGGALRLVKTLSGGQLFQAALALALSLAEQIRDYRQGDRDFFFLDEGFGTQDRDSLILVLDTLKALRAENRSVGIISHVEDLQQEVNAYLKITLDPVRGSLITPSHQG